MEDKKNDLFTIGIIAVILLTFAVMDLLFQAGLIHSAGTKTPVPRPVFTARSFLNGKYFEDYDSYSVKSFYKGPLWSKLVRGTEIILGKREFEGILLGRKNTYFESRSGKKTGETAIAESLDFLEKLKTDYDAKVMLIPTADEVWKDRLPAYAAYFDQEEYLDSVMERVGEDHYVALLQTLNEHKSEEIYYRTAPYWTSLAAYYGYYAWWEKSGKLFPYYYDLDRKILVTNHFVGPFVKRVGMEDRGEEMFILKETEGKQVTVCYDDRVTIEGYYRPEYLDAQNPCGYYLGDEFGVAKIQTESQRKNVLVVIGDLNANVMIPLMAPHYSTILLINPNYYQGDLWGFLAEQKGEDTEYLVLQGVLDFVELFDVKE